MPATTSAGTEVFAGEQVATITATTNLKTGLVTAGGTTTTGTTGTVINDTARNFATDSLIGTTITFTSGPANAQTRTIISNTPTSITVSAVFSPVPTAAGGDTYTVATKPTSGRFRKLLIVVGTGQVDVYDNSSSNTTNQVFTRAVTAVGETYEIDCPMKNGIRVVMAAAGTITCTYD